MVAIWCFALVALAATVIWSLVRRRWRLRLQAGQTVLVTGCDSGFGFSIVKALLEQTGASIVAGCITEDGLQRLSMLGSRVIAKRMDVTKDTDVEAVFEDLKNGGKALWGVVNNAGIGSYGWCEGMSLARYEQNFQVNVLGVIRVTRLALPLLRQSRGRMVTMGSIGGRIPSAFGSTYVPTKAAVAHFQDCVRQEVYRFGVRCSLIEPGFFATGMLHRSAALGEASSIAGQPAGDVVAVYGSYAEKMKRTEGSVRLSEKMNGGEQGVDHVANAVVDALTTVFPRTRYLVGVDANILGRLGPFIPDFVMDLAQTYII